jgi:hypothetical protein
MFDALRANDSGLVELSCGRGSLLIPPALHGRLFCQLDGELVHRLDVEAMRQPSPDGYDNLGGNSLWPAPEGGAFAFNYPCGSDAWYVQEGICRVVPTVTVTDSLEARVEKRILLENRKGVVLALLYQRRVKVSEIPISASDYGLHGLCYHTEDTFKPLGKHLTAEVLLAPWSLEQFPGADGIIAFGKVPTLKESGICGAINRNFYGDPGDRIAWQANGFTFLLGGGERHQIGIRVSAQPQCIGALDPSRSLLLLRRAKTQAGQYFNIADNDQPEGPFSAEDLYSIFNGGELGFFELETIGAMQAANGHMAASTLSSQTWILKGANTDLMRFLTEQEGIFLEEVVVALNR